MPATLPHVDADLFRGLQRDDERALERLFFAWYPTLLDEATPIVNGDKAAAARAVEGVFVQAWRARHDIESAEMLEAGLYRSTRDEAARIQSRRETAHHMDHVAGSQSAKGTRRAAPTVDAAWLKVSETIHVKREAVDAAAHTAAVHSRHEAAEQLGEISEKGMRPLTIIAGLVLAAAGIATAVWFTRGNDESALSRGLVAAGVQTKSTDVGQISTVPLADGSVAKLGPESRVRIPAEFGTKMRGLELTGTANFTVAANKTPNFVVRAGPALITATGTEFAARYIPAERYALVLVREGSITVTVRDSAHPVAAGAGLVVADDSTVRVPTSAELESLAWVDGFLVLTDQPVRDVLVAFRRWYGVGVFTSDTNVLNRRVTMRMPVTSFDAAVTELEKSATVTREMQGSNVVLRTKRK
jgi:ferric-dicitrate binding protein FerR (iron transport regulator)